jgi:hypothetical protein
MMWRSGAGRSSRWNSSTELFLLSVPRYPRELALADFDLDAYQDFTMRKLLLALTICIGLSVCAVTVPCAAKASNEMTFIGSATALLSQKPGSFELYSATGLKCYGTYS